MKKGKRRSTNDCTAYFNTFTFTLRSVEFMKIFDRARQPYWTWDNAPAVLWRQMADVTMVMGICAYFVGWDERQIVRWVCDDVAFGARILSDGRWRIAETIETNAQDAVRSQRIGKQLTVFMAVLKFNILILILYHHCHYYSVCATSAMNT